MSFIISRERIAKTPTLKTIKVDVSEWAAPDPNTGQSEQAFVFVREKDLFEASQIKIVRGKTKPNFADLRARLAVIVCVNQQGEQIFHEGDVAWITSLPARPLSRIYNAAKELNEISDEDEEEILKNLEPPTT